jgi:hypothetical protein
LAFMLTKLDIYADQVCHFCTHQVCHFCSEFAFKLTKVGIYPHQIFLPFSVFFFIVAISLNIFMFKMHIKRCFKCRG